MVCIIIIKYTLIWFIQFYCYWKVEAASRVKWGAKASFGYTWFRLYIWLWVFKKNWLHKQKRHYLATLCFFLPHTDVEQLRKGFLDTLLMKIPVCGHPEDMHSMLVPSGSFDVTAQFFLEEVVIISRIQQTYGRRGSYILHWSDYIISNVVVSKCCGE